MTVAMLVAVGCGGVPSGEGTEAPEATAKQEVSGSRAERDLARLQRRVERITEGLLFLSESDARFIFVSAPDAGVTDVTPEAVVAFLADQQDGRTDLFVPSNAPLAPLADRPFEVLDADAFFARVINTEPRLRALQRVLERELEDLTVIRFGDPGRTDVGGVVSIFIVGRTADGALAGVLTGAVET
jgi:hypothetical protein